MTPQKQRHLLISVALSALTLFFAYLYFSPTPQKKITPILQKDNKADINYDSILTIHLKDTNSKFRKTFDSIYNKPQNKIIKFQNSERSKTLPAKTTSIKKIEPQKKVIKKPSTDTVKPKPKPN